MRAKPIAAALIAAILSLSLIGCSGNDYAKAKELYEAGDYAQAAKIFSSLGDYEDSADLANECNYLQAQALVEAGNLEGALALYQQLGDYSDAADKAATTERAVEMQAHADVWQYLKQEPLYFPGGDETVLNKATFTDDDATVEQVYFDGNGAHKNDPFEGTYAIDDKQITINFSDGTDFQIPYVTKGSDITLGEGEYFTLSQVEKALKGCWELKQTASSYGTLALDSPNRHAYYLELGDGKFTDQEYAEALAGDADYYYYEHEGTYSVGFGVFNMKSDGLNQSEDDNGVKEWEWGIKDAKPVVLHYGNACSKAKSLPSDPEHHEF